MLFFKVEGTLTDFDYENEESRSQHRERIRRIYTKTEAFNERRGCDSFYFVSDSTEGVMTAGIITRNADSMEKELNSYLRYIGCPLKDRTVTEITLNTLGNLLSYACRLDYIYNDDEVLEKFNLNLITGRRGREIIFGEDIVNNVGKKKNYLDSERYLMNSTLLPELDRIYADNRVSRTAGHPVHYILQTDDRDIRRQAYRTLLQALYEKKRLRSRRYCFLDFMPGKDFSVAAYESLYKMCAGGTVVVRYLANDDSEDDGFACSEVDTVDKLCEMARRYRNSVLTVICLPRECKKAKVLFYESLGNMSFVEIQEDFVYGEDARSFLKMLAKENHIRTDKALFAKLKEDEGYLAPDLRLIFDEWYDNKLKTKVYPQYKELKVARHEAVKAAPRGNAYDELHNMIGLTDAKEVINNALNYYKMKKLYEEKGLKRDTPTMHMIFSGNPGTAKTTAARLFARIMKDNGLLSKGQLIEVGRGDLVGKFVGWTAQTVQSKFKAAQGGILFIDEAYSLVDDRNGSYGDEAINTIVQEMENHREDVVVIFAGYPDKMEEFLNKNPGLRSRIAFYIPFEDYTAEELSDIAAHIAREKGYMLTGDAKECLSEIFESARQSPDFGNGRYARNLIEKAVMAQANRLMKMDINSISDTALKTICREDIVIPAELKKEKKLQIGFCA